MKRSIVYEWRIDKFVANKSSSIVIFICVWMMNIIKLICTFDINVNTRTIDFKFTYVSYVSIKIEIKINHNTPDNNLLSCTETSAQH